MLGGVVATIGDMGGTGSQPVWLDGQVAVEYGLNQSLSATFNLEPW